MGGNIPISRASASQSLGEILRRRTTGLLLAASLLLSCPLLLVNALSHPYPLGAAGLFTQMAQQIAAADFRLPLQSPYYGPGSIPFAYPPLGLYLLAVLIKVTGKYLFFLRLLRGAGPEGLTGMDCVGPSPVIVSAHSVLSWRKSMKRVAEAAAGPRSVEGR